VRLAAALLPAVGLFLRVASASNKEDDFRGEVGGFYGHYTNRYGNWGGVQGRFWLLDSTGQRGHSGYLNLIDLYWKPEVKPLGADTLHSTFVMGRYMHNWSKQLYTMTTLGTTFDDAVFPRFQVEQEFDYALPQHPVLVFAVGIGDRLYPSVNRPYLVAGISYSFPNAGLIYRYWVGRGMNDKPSNTHLFTWIYGYRLKLWLRVDLLWGDEAHNTGLLFDTQVDSRGITVTLEQWLTRSLGVILIGEFTEMTIKSEQQYLLHREQLAARVFVTF
jgi:YaiO family outer membrane protein